ncbi:hypothetical protein [Methanoregula sp.]|jgi:hypothetical protein|nr:hypothetical protein [Methanoregula sp.]
MAAMSLLSLIALLQVMYVTIAENRESDGSHLPSDASTRMAARVM